MRNRAKDAMPTVPQPTLVYHITSLENLPLILASDALLCCDTLRSRKVAYRDIALQNIQSKRARTPVTCGGGGTLHDYVPFFFAPRSPMLYCIHRGNVPTYAGGQRPIIYLVTTAQTLFASIQGCAFTNGHAIMQMSDSFDDLADLDKVDWGVMRQTYWNRTPQDNDRQRRREAEFLAYRSVPWRLIMGIGVIDAEIQKKVVESLQVSSHRPPVKVKRDWYYR
jgi:hypothetical protein